MYKAKRKEHIVEKYIQWFTMLSLTIWVYLHSLAVVASQISTKLSQKFEVIPVQGHRPSPI